MIFLRGVPAERSPIASNEIRNNFNELDDRTNLLLVRATTPISTNLIVSPATVYFNDNITVHFAGQQINLGSTTTGIKPFTNAGFLKDVLLVLRTEFDSNNKSTAYVTFLEGPEKLDTTIDASLIQCKSNDIPICHFLVRHNGLGVNTTYGQIEPIRQDAIIPVRNLINATGGTYYTTTVGDRRVVRDGYNLVVDDGYGGASIEGSSIGEFNDFIGTDDPIQQAINYVEALGGGTVFLKRGLYTPLKTIEIPSNVSLIGEGVSTILRREDTFTGPLLLAQGANIVIKDLKILGPETYLNAFGPLVTISSCQRALITNCYIEATDVTGISVTESSSQTTILSNYIYDAQTGIALASGTTRSLVAMNQFLDNGQNVSDSGALTVQSGNVY